MSAIVLLNRLDIENQIETWRAADERFDILLERYDDPPKALRHFGLILWGDGELDLAIAAFTTALSIAPEDARLWSDLAAAFDAASRPHQAWTCVRASLDRDPAQPNAWLLLATLSNAAKDEATAEAAFRNALVYDPTLADAHFGLGILYFNQRRFDESAAALRLSIHHGNANALTLICLGQVLYLTSAFHESAAVFARAARMQELDQNARRKFARAQVIATMIDGRVAEALALYPELAGAAAEELKDVARDCFSLLSAHGHHDAAIELGRIRLRWAPDDPVQRYLLAAVEGAPLRAAPPDYLEAYFDKFAPGFDKQLVEVLRYHVPEEMQVLVARHRNAFADVVDIGCGTGLAAAPLHRFGGRMIGVDISGRMLDEAAKRSLYAELIKAEAVAFLGDHPDAYDLIFAADVMIYIGDLLPLTSAAASALRPGGLFALSIETVESGDFALLPSGRFAQSIAYVERLVRTDFEMLDQVKTMIRLEANRPVEGMLLVLRRR